MACPGEELSRTVTMIEHTMLMLYLFFFLPLFLLSFAPIFLFRVFCHWTSVQHRLWLLMRSFPCRFSWALVLVVKSATDDDLNARYPKTRKMFHSWCLFGERERERVWNRMGCELSIWVLAVGTAMYAQWEFVLLVWERETEEWIFVDCPASVSCE